MTPEPETACAECGRVTRMIRGRCPNCGAVNDASQLLATTPIPRGLLWQDLDDLVVFAGLLVPSAAVLVLTLAGVLPGVAIVVAVLLVVAAIARALL